MLLYVDDILIASIDKSKVVELKKVLSSEFEMKDLGEAKKILGMEISRNRDNRELRISQEDYVWKVLSKFDMDQSKPVSTPMGAHFKLKSGTPEELKEQEGHMKKIPYQSAVGSIMYSMVGTRLDLAYPVGLISRFMTKPLKEHWQAVKWVLRYIKGTVDTRLCYKGKGEFRIKGYCDSDYSADLDHRRSISGMVFTAGGNPVSWRSSLQPVVALSTTEAEYIALSEAERRECGSKDLLKNWVFRRSQLRFTVTRRVLLRCRRTQCSTSARSM